MGAVWGDYDNDGFEDLFLYKYGRPELFHNDGGRGFTPAGERAGLPQWLNANSAVWFDYDRDGWLDLFVAGYWPETLNLWTLDTTRIMPESFEYAENGGRKYLLRNRGDGTFEDTTAAAGITSRRWTLAVGAADLLGTGYPDLFLANDYGVSELFANRPGTAGGSRHFVDVGRDTGVGRTPKSGMNASFGDVFNDGRLSIYKTNISEPGVLVQANDLWVPKASAGGVREFDNLASSLGVDLGGWSWGAQFGDLNNDGTLDIYLVNGYVSAGDRTSYWYDFAEIAVGHSAIIGDARNWPAMNGRSLSGYQRKRVWVNDGLGHFTEVAQIVGATDVHDGRAVALADLSNTGVLDVIVANQRGPLLLYKNAVQPGRHWVAFELEGSASNRSAIGARVELQWSGQSAGAGGQRRQRLQRAEPAPAALRAGRRGAGGPRGDPLALGPAPDDREPAGRHGAQDHGAAMSPGTAAIAPPSGVRSFITLDNRFLGPILITCILVAGHLSFGILEGYERTGVAIATAILAEMALGRLTYGQWPHLASAYITGISVGILVRSPFVWPYFLGSLISITSKYVLPAQRPPPLEPVELRRQCRAVARAGHGVAPQHPVGQHGLADGGHLDPRRRHRLARRAPAHQRDLRRVVLPAVVRPQRGDRQSVAGQRRADHWADVPALHLLHGHRSEDDGAAEVGAVPGRVPGGVRRDAAAAGRGRLCAVLRARAGRAGGAAHRDLAGVAERAK